MPRRVNSTRPLLMTNQDSRRRCERCRLNCWKGQSVSNNCSAVSNRNRTHQLRDGQREVPVGGTSWFFENRFFPEQLSEPWNLPWLRIQKIVEFAPVLR